MRPCLRCAEEVLKDEGRATYAITPGGGEVRFIHHECMLRMVIGSVGHQLKKCPCYGGTEEDPEDVTPREAARLAVEMFQLHHVKQGVTDA